MADDDENLSISSELEQDVIIPSQLEQILQFANKIKTLLIKNKFTAADKNESLTCIGGIISLVESSFQISKELLSAMESTVRQSVREEIQSTVRQSVREEMQSSKIAIEKATYSQVTKIPKTEEITKQPTRPAIIVTANNATSKQEAVDKWRKAISFKTTTYAPSKIQPLADNKLRVEFDDLSQRDETLKRLESNMDITAEADKKLRPMVIMKGISKDTPKDELVDIILQQNPSIKLLKQNEEDLALKFTRDNRKSNNLYNAIFLVTPKLWKTITRCGRVNIDHQRVHASDYIPLLQCYGCLQFGHLKSRCPNAEKQVCSHCSSVTHVYNNCPKKYDALAVECYNCITRNNKSKTQFDTKHSATSSDCPRLRFMKERTSSMVDYGY
ncbi:hypothetical protein NE865_03125 [Phthorimaea operculella]|nr:hypothetical protein NE865_03125 [Phthorimaea operculella]